MPRKNFIYEKFTVYVCIYVNSSSSWGLLIVERKIKNKRTEVRGDLVWGGVVYAFGWVNWFGKV